MKKNRFAILVDESGREKLYLQKLVEMLKEDLSFLKQEKQLIGTRKNISKLKKGDVIVFGSHKKFDYMVVDIDEFEEDFGEDTPVFALAEEFSQVKKQLKKYVRNINEDTCYKINRDLSYIDVYIEVEDEEDDYIVYAPKKKKQKSRKTELVLDEVRVFHNYVQVGWDNYDIYLDAHGDEFVIVNGNVYMIDRSSGKGLLTV